MFETTIILASGHTLKFYDSHKMDALQRAARALRNGIAWQRTAQDFDFYPKIQITRVTVRREW